MEFKEILRNLLIEYDFTQTELAKKLNIKPSQISEWLKGKANPGYETLKNIATTLNLSADYLLGLEDDFGIKKADSPTLPAYSQEERQIIEDYRTLTPALKKMIKDTLKTFTTSEEVKKQKGTDNG